MLLTVRHPWRILISTGLVTVLSLMFASGLEMRMNWTDLLPSGNPIVKSYREVQDRFGDAASLVVALEGDYESITRMAEVLEAKLKAAETLYNVQARLPVEFFREHGLKLLRPNDFDRSLRIYADPGMVGTLRGLNDDYEREYTDNESNLRRDEVDIARSILGLHRTLEILESRFSGREDAETVGEAVDAMTLGEPWLLSLDREMLLILCQPVAAITDIDATIATVEEVDNILDEVRPSFPGVRADLTGMARICQDEMNSVGLYTWILSLVALILIYLLLARSFRGWVMPVIALLPLIAGILWTMALLFVLFGGLNLFTAMMMLVLLGLGIDFSIHLISRWNEETAAGKSIPEALTITLSRTGVAVITGALTSAAAFLTLLIGKTRGVFEFGAATGFGVLLTLVAIFLILPPLLVIRRRWTEKRLTKKGVEVVSGVGQATASEEMVILGKVAQSGWRHPALFIIAALIIVSGSIWSMRHIGYEYDFLNLEPKGLRSIELQREIPHRFGMSDHSAWLVTGSVEESRVLKERFRKKPLIGNVATISDYIPSAERLKRYTPELVRFRNSLSTPPYPPLETSGGESGTPPPVSVGGIKWGGWQNGDADRLSHEVNRLWDNLDLMSNLAYMSGLDRIVKVIDGITGTRTETGEVNTSAVLPTLTRILQDGIDDDTARRVANAWESRMRSNLHSMSDPSPLNVDDLPEVIRRNHLPRQGEGLLVHIVPRKYLWGKEELLKFAEQTTAISDEVVGTEQLILVMWVEILADGRRAALLALAVIVVLLLVHFRGLIGLLSLIPLAGGAMLMLGLMFLIGMKYNYMNLIAVPIILGIGIDDGIHILHRFRNERGSGSGRVHRTFSLVGRAILLTSLTTMIGFGSIAFYTMEGMASFGKVLFMGVGACFLATVLVLPAVLRLFTRNG